MPAPSLTPLERQLLQAKMRVQQEMPDVADAPVEPMGWLGKLISGVKGKMAGATVAAVTSPFGSISYDPAVMQQSSPSEQEDMLAHELTHIRQQRRQSPLERIASTVKEVFTPPEPYGRQPDELEAYQAENDRSVQQGRAPGMTPRFEGTGMREMGDIPLQPDTLLAGSSAGIVAENVRTLMRQGMSQQEAVARAQQEAGKR
jgi:hypothetical protein